MPIILQPTYDMPTLPAGLNGGTEQTTCASATGGSFL